MVVPTRLTSYTVSYDTESHFGVIFQRWGSLWPEVGTTFYNSSVLGSRNCKDGNGTVSSRTIPIAILWTHHLTDFSVGFHAFQVFPYCAANTLLMIALIVINEYVLDVPRLQMSKQGITFISTVVAFLLVSRVNTGLDRFNTARDCLNVMFRESRELIQGVCVFSADNTNEAAKEWRHEVAYRCLILLRTSMAVLDYETDKIPPWKIPELNGVELEDILNTLFATEPEVQEPMTSSVRRWAHDQHGDWEDTLRVPVRLCYLLKKSIHSQNERLTQAPVAWLYESRLLANVDSFMSGYYGIRKHLTTVRLCLRNGLLL